MNTPLLIATALALQGPAAFEIKPPYQAKAPTVYGVAIEIPDQDVAVSATVEVLVTATSETGLRGLLSWKQIVANNEPFEDWEVPIALTLRGALRSAESEFGPDARRMNSIFFPTYPEKPVGEGGEWTFEHRPETANDGPAFTARYTA